MNAILRLPFVKQRIEKFLSETKMSEEFSHTILHNVPRPLPTAGGVGHKPSGPSVGPAREQPRGACTVETGQYRLTCMYVCMYVQSVCCSKGGRVHFEVQEIWVEGYGCRIVVI